MSSNHLVGKIPSVVADWQILMTLSLSNNHLEGSIPRTLVAKLINLVYLDISHNNLTGSVPYFVNTYVRYVHLSNNKLRYLPKKMFNNISQMVILDLSYNEITNDIQDMIRELIGTRLNILILKGNHFTGHLPQQLCQLVDLRILDLSYNNLFGAIPNCLGKIPFENNESLKSRVVILIGKGGDEVFRKPVVHEKANFTTKQRSYTYTGHILAYMSGIDLSCNKLNGSIPSELGNLTRIRALNLSHNDLSGQIPATFSNLLQTESLDLSFNKLSGQIPPQLNGLTSLEVFSVAYNNLSGETPERKGQFITFDESSYEGNPFLCGAPLPKSCGQIVTIFPNERYTDEDNGSVVDMYVFYVSFAVSYASILMIIALTLYINPYWRGAWFYYMELVITNCYYFIEDNLGRFCKFKNM